MNPQTEEEGESQRIISPFAATTSTVQSTRSRGGSGIALWIVSSLLLLVILGIAGYFILQYVNDPYRTLKPFPIDEYLADYRPLAGAKFKADLKVSAQVTSDLGWKPETGRLLVFTVENDTHSLVVLIPPKLSTIFFTKGQTYQVSLEVGEGGLVYADSCEKE